MLVAAESASRVAGPAPAVKDGAGSLDRAEGLDAGADGSGQRVGDEVARADQQRAILLRVVDGAALDDPLEDASFAPDDGEDAVLADVERVTGVETEAVGDVRQVPLDVLLRVVLGHEVGVGLDLFRLLQGGGGGGPAPRGHRPVALWRAGVGAPGPLWR